MVTLESLLIYEDYNLLRKRNATHYLILKNNLGHILRGSGDLSEFTG